MTTICLVATDQLLSVAIEPKVASGDQNSVELHVDFDSKWDRYGKSAVFFAADDETIYEIPLVDGECVIPHEVLANPGILYIGIRGVNADNSAVKTSSLVKYKIAEGAPAGDGTTVEPTADVYQQILTAYKKMNDALAVERARINQFTALAEGSTTGDAELMDIRVDYYGVTHENAGTAVRSQFAKAIATLVSYNGSTGLCNWNAGEILDLANNGRSVVFRTDDMQFIPLAYVDRSIARFDRIVTTTADGMCVETIEIDADGFMTTEEHPIVTDSGAIIEEVATVIVWHDPSRKCSHTAGEISYLFEAFMNGDKYNQIYFLWHGSWLLPLVQADGDKAYFERTMLNEDGKPVLCSIVIDADGYFTKTDKGFVVINDAEIGSDAWSSKNIVDKLCPSFTESGAIVTCEPVEGYPLTVAADAEATTVTRCGKNLLEFKNPYPVEYYSVSGTTPQKRTGWEFILPPGTYTFSATKKNASVGDVYMYGYVVDSDNRCVSGKSLALVAGKTITNRTVNVTTGEKVMLYDGVGEGQSVSTVTKLFNEDYVVQCEAGNTATAFEPYIAETFNPGETIPALPGVNTIWAEKGEVTVAGRADPVAIINKLTNAIIALGGNV